MVGAIRLLGVAIVSLRSQSSLRFAALIICLPLACGASAASAGRPFELRDYFSIKRVTELALSTDGEVAAYVVDQASLVENRTVRQVYVQVLGKDARPEPVAELSDAQQIEWVPGTHTLAYISNKEGTAQVFSFNFLTRESKQITEAKLPVTSFRVAPSGDSIAYMTRAASRSFYDLMRREGPGILVDTTNIGYMQMFDPSAPDPSSWVGSNRLWMEKIVADSPRAITVPGDVRAFHWSSDGGAISVTYVSSIEPPGYLRAWRTSIGLVDSRTLRFSPLATSVPKENGNPGTAFFGGEWIPHENKLVVRRVKEVNPWLKDWCFPSIGVADLDKPWNENFMTWSDVEASLYSPHFIPETESRILYETTLRAQDELIAVGPDKVKHPEITSGLAGSNSLFQFSEDFTTAVFVNQSLARPPEIFVWHKKSGTKQLTTINDELAHVRLPAAKEISWRSVDGVTVSGWLLLPDAEKYKKPWPLVTYVHGGPGSPFMNAFAPLALGWPHPIELYALNGIAVFAPNYRGTRSFGMKIMSPTRIDREPVDDIVTGIESLVKGGVVDADRLAINGHSHGAWLGPLVAARTGMFKVASFAEGWSNQVALYEMHSTALNRAVHEDGMGEESLFDSPERYLELSPDLHFKGLQAASLFESGSEIGGTTQMLGLAKAARHFSIPSEYFIYPMTGHALSSPRLQYESATRNFDWVAFWLLNREDAAPSKRTQYERWRALRRASAARPTHE